MNIPPLGPTRANTSPLLTPKVKLSSALTVPAANDLKDLLICNTLSPSSEFVALAISSETSGSFVVVSSRLGWG
jgi:hypothetical protein